MERNAQAAQVDLASISEPTIILQTGENAGKLMQLVGEQTEWSIGSGADRNLRIIQTGVSANHAAIVREESYRKVVGQMSVNGTFVNGDRINIRYFTDADVLRFGPVECLFVVPADFDRSTNSFKNKEMGLPLWKIAVPIAILLILGAGFYTYSSGLFS
jgi:pSer/pThr/pTyr-binding forkhead associated (FHA) protein